MNLMHLYGDTLERYATRSLPATELTAIDEHISNCMFCTHALAEASVGMSSWEGRGWLGRLVRIEPETPVEDSRSAELDRAA